MDDFRVGVRVGESEYQILKITESAETLSLILSPGGSMGGAVYRNNLAGVEMATHDKNKKEIEQHKYSLHVTPNNPNINTIKMSLKLKGEPDNIPVTNIIHTTAFKRSLFVPIYCERFGYLSANLKKASSLSLCLGSINFQSSCLFQCVFAGPKGRKFKHYPQSDFQYSYIPRNLFDVHIMSRVITPNCPGYAFKGFQPFGSWRDELSDDIKSALSDAGCDDNSIINEIMSAGLHLFRFK